MAGRGALPAGRMMALRLTACFGDFGCLGPFGSLDNFELNRVPFLKSAIAISRDGGIVYENVWTIIAPNEAIPLGIIEPLDSALQFECLLTGVRSYTKLNPAHSPEPV
jgi:hypothetical protein